MGLLDGMANGIVNNNTADFVGTVPFDCEPSDCQQPTLDEAEDDDSSEDDCFVFESKQAPQE